MTAVRTSSLPPWHDMPPENSGSTTSHGMYRMTGAQSPGSAVDTLYTPRVRVFPMRIVSY
eukprot:6998808-Prymnesium_polylepis.1